MFTININKLKVFTKIGVLKKERKKKQPLLISIKFTYKVVKKQNLDNINNLVSYSEIIDFLKKHIEFSEYRTIEKLIVELLKKIKDKFKIKNISIEIEKPKISKSYKAQSLSVSK